MCSMIVGPVITNIYFNKYLINLYLSCYGLSSNRRDKGTEERASLITIKSLQLIANSQKINDLLIRVRLKTN